MGTYEDSFLTSWGESVEMPPEAHLTGGRPQEQDPDSMTSWSRADEQGIDDERTAEDARQAAADDPHLRDDRGRFATPEKVLREAHRREVLKDARRGAEGKPGRGAGGKAGAAATKAGTTGAGMLGALFGQAAAGAGKGVGAAIHGPGGKGSTGGFKDAERRGLFRKPKKKVKRRTRTVAIGPFRRTITTEREKGY